MYYVTRTSLKQLQDFNQGRWETHLNYWHGQFTDIPPPLPLLTLSQELSGSETTEYASHSVKIQFNAALKGLIKQNVTSCGKTNLKRVKTGKAFKSCLI